METAQTDFGRVCLLRLAGRTLAYLLPGTAGFEASVVLGERAVARAQASDLPDEFKQRLATARAYAEGRSIRFPVTAPGALPVLRRLVRLKLAAT